MKPEFIYLLSNASMPGILKVGRTTQNPRKRAEELSGSTGVPTPFSVAYALQVADSASFESHIHELLDQYRINQNREFFSISISKAVEIIENEARLRLQVENLSEFVFKVPDAEIVPEHAEQDKGQEAIRAFQNDSVEDVEQIWKLLINAPHLDPWTMGPDAVPKEPGVYTWYDQATPIYIGRIIAQLGLYQRIVNQHLNPRYLEPRQSKFTKEDHFQLNHPIRDGKNRVVIDKSAFRKKVARAHELTAGEKSVKFIKTYYTFSFLSMVEAPEALVLAIEAALIRRYQPRFNS